MSDYNKLANASSNVLRLLLEQNSVGTTFGAFDGAEPLDVLISKVLYNVANSGTSIGDVTSVNGETGAVILTKSDVGLGSVPNTDATNASNLASGTVPSARMPAHSGDVTSSAGSVALTIANDAVTYAKIQNVSAAAKLLGRGDSAAGDVQEITIGSNLVMTGTTLSSTASGTGDVSAASNFGTDNRILRSDGTLKGTQSSAISIDDSGNMAGINNVTINGTFDVSSATIVGIFSPLNGGTGVANNALSTLTRVGNHAITITTIGTTGVTFPTAGTLATLGGVEILSNKKVLFNAGLATDDAFDGICITGVLAGEDLAAWDLVYMDSTPSWKKADANGSGTYPARGMATGAALSGAAVTVLVQGTARNDSWSFAVGGAPIYLSTTAGALTQTPPGTSGDKVQAIGYATYGVIGYFDFNSTYLTVA